MTNKTNAQVNKKWANVYDTFSMLGGQVHYRSCKNPKNNNSIYNELEKLEKYILFIKNEMLEKCMANEGVYIKRSKDGNIQKIYTLDDIEQLKKDKKTKQYKHVDK